MLRGLKLLLKYICKGLLWLIDATGYAIERLQAFWNDNNTQEKLRKMKAGLIAAGEQLWAWTVAGSKATWRGLVWLAKKTVQGIIHLGPTLKAIGRGLKKAACAVGRWFQRAWRRFRQNKGFKGLLIDLGNWLKGQIRDYIEEEPLQRRLPAETIDEAVDDDDADDPFRGLEDVENPSKVQTFGRRIYNAMKRIVEDD